MLFKNALELLSNNACASIKYRVRKEILNELEDTKEMTNLQRQILDDKKVQEIFEWQKPNGWLGEKFHSGCDPETGIRLLIEKGVSEKNPVIISSLNALQERESNFDEGCLQKVGKVLDKKHLGGSNLIKATVFAYAGAEDELFVQEQINEAIDAFKYILSVNSIDDIMQQYKNLQVFTEGAKWPSIYHLRLLAFTKKWRTDSNIDLIIESVKKLVKFSPIPDIKVLDKSQVISPASAFMLDFNPNMDNLTPKDWMIWFHRTELLARLGTVNSIYDIKKQVDYLKQYLFSNGGLFKMKIAHTYFHKWNMYTGLALEDGWKSPTSRVHDLTFRSMLILYYSNNLY